VHYVVPDGFQGAILIYYDTPDGITLKKDNDQYTIRVPSTGVLRIRGKGPFFGWCSLTASYENGRNIPVAYEPEKLAKDTIAFWPHGSRNNKFIYDFVGTRSENKEFSELAGTGDIIPGRVRE
jgi:hypothetical protein